MSYSVPKTAKVNEFALAESPDDRDLLIAKLKSENDELRGGGKNTKAGREFELRVLEWFLAEFPGIDFHHQFPCGETPIGTHRRVDIAAVEAGRILVAIECKFQDNMGTTDDKILGAVEDLEKLRASSNNSIGILLLWQGKGWKNPGRTFGPHNCAFEFAPDDTRLHRILRDEFCLAAGKHGLLTPLQQRGLEFSND